MKVINITFDSLNRNMLQPYGCDWTKTPNFTRLAERTVCFDSSYVCSMPCMPARRDLHTGRSNFFHRSWGPLEPWDQSVFQVLQNAGISSHIVTDHQHYWEEGAGGNYLTKYTTHAMVRGQEGDPHYPMLDPPPVEQNALYRNAKTDAWTTQDRVNRSQMQAAGRLPMEETFDQGLDFIERHHEHDNWLLHIETFDPHEPFFTLPEHRERYAEFYEQSRGFLWDWPGYGPVKETQEEVERMRHNYAALMTQCDVQVGRVLDAMDRHDMWDDTLLVVWTDHGFCLGEHDCWAKCWLPFYEEVARTPFFMWDPRSGVAGESRQSLVQPAIDLAPTLLDFFQLEPMPEMTGRPLRTVLEEDTPIRETAVFGQFGLQVNVTDGRYVYMRGPAHESNQPLFEYSLMPAHMRSAFTPDELESLSLGEPFSFTQGIPPLKIPATDWPFSHQHPDRNRTLLFDLDTDPGQKTPIYDPETEKQMTEALKHHLIKEDAPNDQWMRLGVPETP
jgi:arylsulfatase A-like enzyme